MKVLVDPSMPDHWKLKRLSELLYSKRKFTRSIGLAAAVGHVQALWCRVAERAPHGNLRGWPGEEVARAGLWPGDFRVFIRALLKCELIEKNADGDYVVHDWIERQGDIAAEREKERLRKAEWRARRKGVCPAPVPPDVTRDRPVRPVAPFPSLPFPSKEGERDTSRPAGQDPPSASPKKGTEADGTQPAPPTGPPADDVAQEIASVLRGRGWNSASERQRLDAAAVIVGRLGPELARVFASDPQVKPGDVLDAGRAVDVWKSARESAERIRVQREQLAREQAEVEAAGPLKPVKSTLEVLAEIPEAEKTPFHRELEARERDKQLRAAQESAGGALANGSGPTFQEKFESLSGDVLYALRDEARRECIRAFGRDTEAAVENVFRRLVREYAPAGDAPKPETTPTPGGGA